MLRSNQREVLLHCPGHVMREERTRVGIVEKVSVARDDDQRRARIANVFAISVDAWNSQARTQKLAIVEPCDCLPLPRPAYQAVP